MPRLTTLARVVAALALCAVVLAACGKTAKQQTASTVPAGSLQPTTSSVKDARFVSSVQLDGGELTVTTPPLDAHEAVSQADAQALFDAADIAAGTHTYAVFGLGVATISPEVQGPTTSTTAPATTVPSTTVPSTAPATTVPSTAPATTVPSTAPPTTAPATTTTASAKKSGARARATPFAQFVDDSSLTVHQMLAWVGMVWGGVASCPATASKGAHTEAVTTYEVVMIDAQSPHHVVAYSSGGEPACGGSSSPPSVSLPQELVSVPWQPAGPTSTGVTITIPPCGAYYGWTELPATTAGTTVQVIASVPYDPSCASTVTSSQTVDSVVPIGQGGQFAHAPTGPVDAINALSQPATSQPSSTTTTS